MRRNLLVPLLVVGLIFVPQALAQDQDDDFAGKVAGTWLGTGWFTLDFDCDGNPDNPDPDAWTYFDFDSQSFGAGGLYVSTNPANPNTGQGTWKRTGARKLTTNNITYLNVPWPVILDVDPETGEFTGTGLAGPGLGTVPAQPLRFIARIPGVFTFDRTFQTATSHFGAIAYLPTQDPLDESETPFFCTVGQHTLLRKVAVD